MSDLIIDGNKLMMGLADWWYSSFGQEETEEAIAIRKVMDQVEKSLENYKADLPSAQPLYENITELKEHLKRILASCSTEGDYNTGFANGLSLYTDELEWFENKAQSERLWIPCSTKLPKILTPVLVTVKVEDDYKVAHDWVYDNEKWAHYRDVVAWMPLPDPYREDDEK